MRSNRSYQREILKLKNMVANMLWVQPAYNGSPSCSYCGVQQHWHDKHCEASKLVADEWSDTDIVRQQAVTRG